MSGGSLNYLYRVVLDALPDIADTSVQRSAFKRHLKLVADALRAVEWNDSGDGDPDEEALIAKCIPQTVVTGTAISLAEDALVRARAEMAKLREEWEGER